MGYLAKEFGFEVWALEASRWNTYSGLLGRRTAVAAAAYRGRDGATMDIRGGRC